MNIGGILGFVGAGLVVWFGVFATTPNPKIFMDTHALILVFGGTATAALIAFPIKKVAKMMYVLFKVAVLRIKITDQEIVESIAQAAPLAKSNPVQLGTARSPHPFCVEGFQLIAEGILTEQDLQDVLVKRAEFYRATYSDDAKIFQALAKFPPAFGLLGAVTGMIAMMGKLGSENSSGIGAAMAIALVATFWGIAIANLIFLPLAEFYFKLAQQDHHQRTIIVDGLMMLKRRESPAVVFEKLNSHLAASERTQQKASGSANGGSERRSA